MAHRSAGASPFRHLPYLADIARDDHSFVVIQKSAQVGATELLVNLALWAADTGYAGRGNVLFLMPTQNQMDDFSQARFDRALQDNPYLRSRLQPEPPRRKGADSKRLKHLGPGYIYLRGADSRRQVASVDADLVIMDEYDQMGDGVLELARKRLSSSARSLLRVASTPRIPEAGINGLYLQSDQRRYFLACAGCGLEQYLTWEQNVDKTRARVVCRKCRSPLDVMAGGRWVATAPGNRIHGYHLSRLYSPWGNILEMVDASEGTTPSELQEFQNSDLGEAFVPPGGGLSLYDLDRCRRAYSCADYAGQPCDVGVDIGTHLHAVIREQVLPPDTRPRRLFFAGVLDRFEELDRLISIYHAQKCVVDALPETHKARELAARHPEVVWLAYYDRHDPRYEAERTAWNQPNLVHVNRVDALDETFQRFREGRVELPRDARQLGGRVKDGLGEYYREVLTPKRTLEQDTQGNWVSKWVDNGKADHFAHAELYCLLADWLSDKYRPWEPTVMQIIW